MSYWNQDNFEGMEQLAETLADDPQLSAVSRYCSLRSKGLRKPALQEIDDLLDEAGGWSIEDRRATTNRLLDIAHDHPEAHQFLPQPLIVKLLVPTLEEWVAAEPSNSVPHRWLGVLSRERSSLETALLLDRADDIARRYLIAELIGDVHFATHHLDQGFFIGEEDDAEEQLQAIEALLAEAPDRSRFQNQANRYEQLRTLVDDWNRSRND